MELKECFCSRENLLKHDFNVFNCPLEIYSFSDILDPTCGVDEG